MTTEIAFIIPAFNEELIIARSAELLARECDKAFGSERSWLVVIAENGSSDETFARAREVAEKSNGKIRALSSKASGRARALRQACDEVQADVYCYLDADLPMDLQDLGTLIDQVRGGAADVVVARRAGDRPLKRRLLSVGFRTLNRLLFDVAVHDAQCGVKVWSRRVVNDIFPNCHETGYFFDTELLALAQKKKIVVAEQPIQWIEQRFPERTSKVRPVKDTLAAFKSLLQISHRLYPDFSHAVLLVVLFGLLIFGLFFEQRLIVSPGHFEVPTQNNDHPWPVVWNILIGSVAYCGLGFVLYLMRRKHLPWKFLIAIASGFFALALVIALVTEPTRSQDVYWNLYLVRGWTEYQMNPYITTPDMLPVDQFAGPVMEWKNLSMTHGPLWVWIVSLVTQFAQTITAGLVGIKLFNIAALSVAIGFIGKTLTLRGWNDGERAVAVILLLLNPLLIQMAVVDAHNDAWVMLSIAVSVYFFQRKQFAASSVALIAGALVKYVTVFVFPVPVVALLASTLTLRKKMQQLVWIVVGGCLLLTVYIPFGLPWLLTSGLNNELTDRGSYNSSLLPTFVLHRLFGWDIAELRLFGISLALVVLSVLLIRRQFSQALFWPTLILLSVGNPWFQSWYLLWLVPLFLPLGVATLPIFILTISIVYLVPDVIYSIHTTIVVFIPLFVWLLRFIWLRIKNTPLKRGASSLSGR